MADNSPILNRSRCRAIWQLLLVCPILGGLLVSGCRTQVGGQSRDIARSEPLSGELELSVEKRTDEQGASGSNRRYESLGFKEVLRLKTQGDVYHPDFFSYLAGVGMGLSQNTFESDDQTEYEDGTINEYNVSGNLLAQKSYPLSFNLDKSEDIIPRQFASSLLSQRQGSNVTLALRSDWPMRFQYGQSDIQQEGLSAVDRDHFSREDEQFSYALDHRFGEQSDMSFDFHRLDASQWQSTNHIERQEDTYGLSHQWFSGPDKKKRLDSFVNYLDQTGDFELKRLLWQEQLTLKHTDRFKTHYHASFHDSQRVVSSNDELRGETGFTHRLFESLVTTGSVYTSQADLGQDVDLTRLGGNVALDYNKQNPFGTLLGYYGYSLLDLDQTGGSTVVSVADERHAYTLAGSGRIRLDRANISASTIIVRRGVDRARRYYDFTVSQTNGITEVYVLPTGDIFQDGDQTLSFDYDAVTEPEREEISATHSVRLRQRFPLGISTYYELQNRSETVTATDASIIPDEFTINLFGVDYTKKGFRILGEYRDEKSTRIPSQSKRVEASYLARLSADTRLSVYGSNSWIDYSTEPAYDVSMMMVGGNMSTQLTHACLLKGGVDYRFENDTRQGQTRGFQYDAEMAYTYRQLSARLGAEFNTLNRLQHERESVFVYMRLKRSF
ncbi:MAG: hypothetical protein GY809_03420 [Planctomycetes bacterium]|nr:hypothetical protein [Planctomycetota bacterium]